jgi:uncharacterized protein (TIGR02231 family)
MSIIALMMAVFLSASTQAQTRQPVNLEHVTVFLNGAELYSTAKLTLPAGESEILFTNVAGNVNQQSLTIGADNQVVVQSATFQNNYLASENASPAVKAIQDSIDLLSDNREALNNKLLVLTEQLAVLQENRKVTGENNGLSVAELQKMLDLVSAKMEALLTGKQKLTKDIAKINERVALLQKQKDEEMKKGFQPGGQLLVKLHAPRAGATNVKLSYVVPNAGWSPTYDLRVESLAEPVHLYYKANVFQNSGIRWDKVKITLSTGNPNEGAEAPAIQPWYLSFYNPALYQGYTNAAGTGLSRRFRAEEDGRYLKTADVQESAAPPIAAINAATLNNYVQVDNSGVNTMFDIDLPYTIMSDGQQQTVAVKTYELPATYHYYAVPKLDRDAFLQARITDWADLNLLPAPTNIFYEGTYVGQGHIDMRNVNDTMTLSLGRDKKIIVKRIQDKKYKSIKTIGSNIRESAGYSIQVRNTRKQPIQLEIVDQLPVSNDKSIVVEDAEAADATINENTGSVKWTIQLAPEGTRDLKIAYTVKYPKGNTLASR